MVISKIQVSDPGPSWPSCSCLRSKVYSFGKIFVKLKQFVHFIKSFNPTDFGKKIGQSEGKSSHFKLKICISCLCNTACICCQIFVKLGQFACIINSLNPIDFQKNWTISRDKVAISS